MWQILFWLYHFFSFVVAMISSIAYVLFWMQKGLAEEEKEDSLYVTLIRLLRLDTSRWSENKKARTLAITVVVIFYFYTVVVLLSSYSNKTIVGLYLLCGVTLVFHPWTKQGKIEELSSFWVRLVPCILWPFYFYVLRMQTESHFASSRR